ncbi:hypothetical protein FisN_12Hh130 [Fistulifera solaris]|uniref:Response regulatory domain-containing protein n=1 Tax=Fistulifera solaris TaxID=1519565 RepID=A0A1Z5KBE1_FISSO|nr:hypothetical protein FisN_12Hh130 [Fistulifera solaris]|eukprot:GAX23567.1 hypothetical protein FisN_12Hh130 [Fistulifera solaris]
MLHAISSSPVRADNVNVFSVSLFCIPRDLQQKQSPRHNYTKCARSRMPANLKQRRVIFPALYGESMPSPRSTIDCISEVSETKKDLPGNLTLKDIALSHGSDADFKCSHMLPLSPLLSREQMTRLDLDVPAHFVPALPLTPRMELGHNTAVMKQNKLEREENNNKNKANMQIDPSRSHFLRAAQPTNSNGRRRSILPVRVSPLRALSSSTGSDSFNSDISLGRSDRESDTEPQKVKKHPSILRSSSYGTARKQSNEVEKVSSIESDIPSLASSDTSDNQSPVSDNVCPDDLRSPRPISHPQATRDVVFDARVLVREFSRSEEEALCIWYTAGEMHAFKLEATRRIMAFTRTEIIPTGTGRVIERQITPTATKALFSHAALRADAIDLTFPALDSLNEIRPPEARKSIKRILIVDPHDICLKLFAKAFQHAIPDAVISTCKTSEEAFKQVLKTTFDLIIVEERLKLFHRQQPGVCGNANASGSLLLQRFAAIAKNRPVLVGVSAHLPEDSKRLKEVGKADLLWSKPPPPLSTELLAQLDSILESKRMGIQQDANLC